MKIVITGGANGIGRELAELFAMDHQVAIIDIDGKALNQIEHSNIFTFNGDLAQKADIHAFKDFIIDSLGTVDVLINNACIINTGILSGLSYEDFVTGLSIGVAAPYELARILKKELINNHGHIINMTSTRAFQSEADMENYAAIKGALVSLTHSLAISLSPNVCVNAIAPGWINAHGSIESELDKLAIPLNRVGRTTDIFNTIMFLINQSYITGECIKVDGGMNKQLIYHNESNWQYKGEQ